jgi:hypothetical protein
VAGRLALPSRAAVAVAALRLSAADCCLFHNVSWIQGYPDFTYALSDVSSRPNSPIGVHGEFSQLRQVCCLLPKLAAPEHNGIMGLTTRT